LNWNKYLSDYQVCEKRNRGEIDELIVWGAPYFGIYESAIAGPGGFFYNSPPISGTSCNKLLPIMGMSYERGDEMLHNYGHRVESVMKNVYGSWEQQETHAWNRFSLINQLHPGSAACGNIHYPPNTAPNSPGEYIYDYQGNVLSDCDDWQNYPNLTGQRKSINCSVWGCNAPGFYQWWLAHIPRNAGKTGDKWNNWWKYVLDYDCAMDASKCPLVTPTAVPTVIPTLTPVVVPSVKPTPTVQPTPTLTSLTCQSNGTTWCENHGGIALTVPFEVTNWSQCLAWCNQNMDSTRPICQYNGDGPRNCWVNKPPVGGIGACNWKPGVPPYGSCLTNVPTVVKRVGDFNNDGKVDVIDFGVWKSEYLGKTTTKLGDANGDGKVNLVDFVAWKTEFLKN
jgi:hypothetical protein